MRSEYLRVVVHDYLGHPHQVELSRELARRGHHVLHVYCDSLTMTRGSVRPLPTDPSVMSILGVRGPRGGSDSHFLHRAREWRYARETARAIKGFGAHVVLSGNAPPLVQYLLTRTAPFVYWLQDMVSVPGAVKKTGPTPFLAAANQYTVRIDQLLEKRALRNSAQVVAISSIFLPRLAAMGVPRARTQVIENWGPEELLTACPGPWAPVQDIKHKREPVLLYAGTLDGRHGGELLAGLAEHCARLARGVVVLTSQGAAVEELRALVADSCPDRLRIFGFQPFSTVPDMLASADLLLVSLSEEAAAMSVPSKVLSYLCVGRPVLAAVPVGSPVAELVRKSGAGVVVDPGDPAQFAKVAIDLVSDPAGLEAMGRAGRRFAEKHFSIAVIADHFESVVRSVA